VDRSLISTESDCSIVELSLRPGTLIGGRYRLVRELGAGSTGVVYAATQLSVDRLVALKLLAPDRVADEVLNLEQRFCREVRLVSMLEHPNIVRVFDFGSDERTGIPFLAMEYVRGRSLKDHLSRRGPLDELRAVKILVQIARALTEAEARSIVHRDLKPENIMIVDLPDGERHVKVLDFGMAKLRGETLSCGSLTASGALVGTPLYMSPEQIRSEPVDIRSDLYALGCLLHEMLTGSPPFRGTSLVELVRMHLEQPAPELPEVLASGAVPSHGLRALHRLLLAKDRRDRPANALSVADILGSLAHPLEEDRTRLVHKRRISAVKRPDETMSALALLAAMLAILVSLLRARY
jgi:eukaryotic-like serine/threonine-protein kinase